MIWLLSFPERLVFMIECAAITDNWFGKLITRLLTQLYFVLPRVSFRLSIGEKCPTPALAIKTSSPPKLSTTILADVISDAREVTSDSIANIREGSLVNASAADFAALNVLLVMATLIPLSSKIFAIP